MASRGNRNGTPDHSHSPAATERVDREQRREELEGRTGRSERGPEEEPVCRQTTVPVSSHAAKSGSQWPLKMEGNPSWAGNSGKLMARKPRSAFLCISPTAMSMSARKGSWSGMIRDGYGAAQASWCQSLHAQAGQAQLLVLSPGIDGPAESRDQGGETERGPDAGPIHVGDPLVDVEATRAHLVEPGRFHAPLLPRPADHRIEPDVRVVT